MAEPLGPAAEGQPVPPQQSSEEKLERLVCALEGSGLLEYVELARKPHKLLLMNFVIGIARGLGFTIGTAIILAILYQVIGQLISMNIPYLTELLEELVILVKGIK